MNHKTKVQCQGVREAMLLQPAPCASTCGRSEGLHCSLSFVFKPSVTVVCEGKSQQDGDRAGLLLLCEGHPPAKGSPESPPGPLLTSQACMHAKLLH